MNSVHNLGRKLTTKTTYIENINISIGVERKKTSHHYLYIYYLSTGNQRGWTPLLFYYFVYE